MSLNSSDENVLNILLNSDCLLQMPYCSWFFGSEEIFVSKKFQDILSIDDCILEPRGFVRAMRSVFGNFLTTAIDSLSGTSQENEFKSTIRTSSGRAHHLKLTIDREKLFYMIVIEKQIESQKNYHILEQILDQTPAYIWQKNINDKIVYCNKKYADALETTKNLVLENNINLISSAKPQEPKRDPLTCFSHPKTSLEHVIVHGARLALNITEFPLSGNNPALGIAIDVTENEELKKKYKSYQRNIEEILENISIPIAIFDQKMNFVLANTAIKKLFSIETSYLNSERSFTEIFDLLYDHIILIDVNNFQQYKEKAIKLFTNVIEPHHTLLHLQNGKTLNITISPDHSGGLMFLFEDISDRIALEREVNSLYAVQKETLEQLIEGIFVFGIDNKIKMTNQAMRKMWGKDIHQNYENVQMKHFFEESEGFFNSNDELELWISKLINIASKRTECSDTIKLSPNKSLDYGYVPLPDGLHLIKFFDSTNLSNAERDLQEKNTILSNIDHVKTNLLSNISYEISAPLNTIVGFIGIIANQYFGTINEKQALYCNGIINAATKLLESVDVLTKLGYIEASIVNLNCEQTNILDFIKNIDMQLKNKNITMKTDFADETFVANIDKDAISYVLMQVLTKKEIDQRERRDFFITISCNKIKNNFSINISIPDLFLHKNDIAQIMNIFNHKAVVQNNKHHILTLAAKIIELHSGEIAISSKTTETSISLTLPIGL